MKNKLMYLMMRESLHFENISADYNPLKNQIEMKINSNDFTGKDNIIYNLANCIKMDEDCILK